MCIHVTFDPPGLTRWLTPSEQQRTLLLVDMEVDVVDHATLRFDLDVLFRAIALRRGGGVERADFYIGATGAHIYFHAEGGQVRDYTSEETLNVQYSAGPSRTRERSVELKPELTVHAKVGAAKASLGSVALRAGETRQWQARFVCADRTLVPQFMGHSVQWTLAQPRVENVLRDYLLGNVILYAVAEWSELGAWQGYVRAWPSEVAFFGPDRGRLGRLHSLRMRYEIWRSDLAKIQAADGIMVRFTATQGDVQ